MYICFSYSTSVSVQQPMQSNQCFFFIFSHNAHNSLCNPFKLKSLLRGNRMRHSDSMSVMVILSLIRRGFRMRLSRQNQPTSNCLNYQEQVFFKIALFPRVPNLLFGCKSPRKEEEMSFHWRFLQFRSQAVRIQRASASQQITLGSLFQTGQTSVRLFFYFTPTGQQCQSRKQVLVRTWTSFERRYYLCRHLLLASVNNLKAF